MCIEGISKNYLHGMQWCNEFNEMELEHFKGFLI